MSIDNLLESVNQRKMSIYEEMHQKKLEEYETGSSKGYDRNKL